MTFKKPTPFVASFAAVLFAAFLLAASPARAEPLATTSENGRVVEFAKFALEHGTLPGQAQPAPGKQAAGGAKQAAPKVPVPDQSD